MPKNPAALASFQLDASDEANLVMVNLCSSGKGCVYHLTCLQEWWKTVNSKPKPSSWEDFDNTRRCCACRSTWAFEHPTSFAVRNRLFHNIPDPQSSGPGEWTWVDPNNPYEQFTIKAGFDCMGKPSDTALYLLEGYTHVNVIGEGLAEHEALTMLSRRFDDGVYREVPILSAITALLTWLAGQSHAPLQDLEDGSYTSTSEDTLSPAQQTREGELLEEGSLGSLVPLLAQQ